MTPADQLRSLARWLPRFAMAGLVLVVLGLLEFIWLGDAGEIPVLIPGVISMVMAVVVTRLCRPLILANAERMDEEGADG